MLIILLLALHGSAAAHSEVTSTDPEADSTVKKPVDHLYVNFSEKPSEDSVVKVSDGCGDTLVAETYVTQKTLHVLLDKKGSRGDWTVTYRIISAEDGHETSGSYGFTVKGKSRCGGGNQGDGNDEDDGDDGDDGLAGGPDATPTSDEGSSFPVVVVLIGVLAAIGIAIVIRVAGSSK